MNRRRALMSAQEEQLIDAIDIPNGSAVAFSLTTATMYIKIGNIGATDDTRLPGFLKEYCLTSKKKMWDDSSHLADYEGSIVDTYLTTTFHDLFSQKMQDNMAEYTLNVTAATSDGNVTKQLPRKIFVTRSSWVADSGFVTTALKTYYNTTSANTARIAKTSAASSAGMWWAADKSTSSTTKFGAIAVTGAPNTASVTYNGYVRPIVMLKRDTKFKLINGIYRLV